MEQSNQSSTLTRTPIEKAETPVSSSTNLEKVAPEITGDGKTEPTPKELVALNRPPYLTDLLEAHQEYSTFDIKDQIGEIDTFIQAEMERKGLDDTREDYDKVLKELWKQIKPSSVYTNIEQLRDYVRIQQRLIDDLEEKKKFEAMDPQDMSAKQLERFLKEHGGKY